MTRIHGQSGIAIGIILFFLAMIAVVTIAISAGGNMTGSTITPDRIMMDLKSQTNLIRNKILECTQNAAQRLDINFTNPAGAGYVSPFPVSTGSGTAIENVECPSYGATVSNLWTGQAPLMLPPPPRGLEKWYYVNAGDMGGRCVRIQPEAGSAADAGIKSGIANTAGAFTSQEITYDPESSSQRFILWITRPTGTTSVDCSS
jgi:hypothetical protein